MACASRPMARCAAVLASWLAGLFTPSVAQMTGFPVAVGALLPAEGGRLQQGYLESSNVNIVTEMMGLVEANRHFGLGQKLVTVHDQLLQKASNDLGRTQ